MVEGDKELDTIKGKISVSQAMIGIISILTVVGIILVLWGYLSPRLPIPEVSCANNVSSSQIKGGNAVYSNMYLYNPYDRSVNNTVNNHANNKKNCYRISDVLSLNKAIHITDAISMVTLLLTFFAIAVPLIFYFNFQQEKKSIEKKLYLHKKGISGEIKSNINNEVNIFLPIFARIMGNVESFKTEYLHVLKINKVSDQKAVTDVADIATNLYRLLSEKDNIMGLLANIESLSRLDLLDRKENYRTYAFLKSVFRNMYEINIFDTREKENALDAFSQRVFKLPLRTLLMYEDPVKPKDVT